MVLWFINNHGKSNNFNVFKYIHMLLIKIHKIQQANKLPTKAIVPTCKYVLMTPFFDKHAYHQPLFGFFNLSLFLMACQGTRLASTIVNQKHVSTSFP